MKLLENISLWATVACYALALLSIIVGLATGKAKAAAVGLGVALAALLPQAVAIIARWINADHIPVTDTYENSLVGTFCIMALFFGLYRRKDRAMLGAFVVAVCLFIIGHGITTGTDPRAYTQQFGGIWLPVHVMFALLSFGAYTISTGLAGIYLLKTSASGGNPESRISKLPSPEPAVMEDFTLRFVLLGFTAHAVMIGSGAIWANGLWGRYWGWDPVETWSLLSWIIYGIVIHLRVTIGWKGRKLAWLVFWSFLGILMAFGGISFVTSVHVGIF